jgi:PPOX class probable F420-dependent enzyme
MRINQKQARSAFQSARVARLATASRHGHPHLVPVTFALRDDLIITAIDHKPKSSRKLKRVDNIEENPNVTILADHYDEDWSLLWWARADGVAEITEALERPEFVELLTAKYQQYRQHPPAAALIVVRVRHWSGWRGQS